MASKVILSSIKKPAHTTLLTAANDNNYLYLASSRDESGVTRSFTYTANGNIATDNRGTAPDAAFTYSNRNRLKLTTVGGVDTSYKYNALGERLIKVTPDEVLHYVYDQQGHIIAETHGNSGTPIREYIYLDDQPVAQIEADSFVINMMNSNMTLGEGETSNLGDGGGELGGSPVIYYLHPDHINTVQKITDGAQTKVWDRIQQPFGEVHSLTSPNISHNLRFPGQFSDAESGLNYNMMRDYDPSIGRYIQSDPIGLWGASKANMNIYGYANQNAFKYIDPWGFAGIWIEGSSYGEPGPHQSIGIGYPNGKNRTYSFGVNSGQSVFGGQGAVYLDMNKGGKIYNYHDVPDDLLPIIQHELDSEIGKTDKYNVLTNNCRTYANNKLDTLLRTYDGLNPAMAPDRISTPSGYYPGGPSGAPAIKTGVWIFSPGPTSQ